MLVMIFKKIKKAPQSWCYANYNNELCIIISIKPQWVYKYTDKFYIEEKKNKLCAQFINNSLFYKVPFYRVVYYTTEKGIKAENKVKKALQKLVEETCFIIDIVKNTKIEFKEVLEG